MPAEPRSSRTLLASRQLCCRAGGAGARPPHPERLDSNDDYWAFADWAMTVRRRPVERIDRVLRQLADIVQAPNEARRISIAAQVGYTGGPTRNDARAKRMAPNSS